MNDHGERSAACCVCHNTSDWFYESISLLQSKHSEKLISVILKLIMGEELASDWSVSDTMCFECVDKINDYDEAFVKMHSIECELKLIYQNTRVKLENEDSSVYNVCPMPDVDEMTYGDGAGAFQANPTNDPFDEKPSMQSFEIHITEANDSGDGKAQFDCEQCGLCLATFAGLKIHIARAHTDPQQVNCSNCHKLFPNKHALEMHTRKAKCKPANISCTICHERFSEPRYLKGHMAKHNRTQNLGPPFQCEFCGIDFDEHEELLEHKQHHLNRPHYQCLECEYIGKTTKLLKQHMRTHTKWNICDICSKGFANGTFLQTHVKNHHSNLNLECYICKHISKSARELREHMRSEHPTLDCTKCGKRFASNDELSLHSCTRIPPQQSNWATLKCDVCRRTFLTGAALAIHVKYTHKTESEEPPGECNYCGIDFGDVDALADHKKLHLNRPEFQCIQCERVVTTKKSLKQHMRTHTGERPYECTQCGQRFTQTSGLSTHRKIYHVSQTQGIDCDQCGESFDDFHSMKEHRKLHKTRAEIQDNIGSQSVKAGIECVTCLKRFPNIDLLEAHKIAATCTTTSSDFICRICQEHFPTPRTLKNHIGKHNLLTEMDPPFECDYCGVEFGEYVELREHKTLHSNRVHFQCLKCEYIAKTTKLLKQHMRKHMKLNRCDECDKGFMTAAALQKHVENHDNDLRDQISDTADEKPTFHCTECAEQFANDDDLNAHTCVPVEATQSDKAKVECDQCGRTFRARTALTIHLKCTHKIENIQPGECSYCGMDFGDTDTLTEHKKLHLNRPDFQCIQCERVVSSRKSLKEHMRIHTGSKPYECNQCGKRFTQSSSLNTHMAIHNYMNQDIEMKQPLECNHCGMEFVDVVSLNSHKEMHSNGPHFNCTECEFVVPTRSSLKTHMLIHVGEKRYECSECDQRFALESNRNIHTSMHFVKKGTKRPIDCDQCTESFSSQTKLMKHSAKFHKDPGQFECTICTKVFPNKLLLEEHTACATCKPPEFMCQICQKGFILPRYLKMHMEFHVRETKRKSLAKCDYCGFVLRNSELLIEHKEQHQSRPDFQCLECEFMGKTNNQLKRHMRVHTKQLRYQCDVCGKAFYDSSSFHSHLKYHNNELNVECYLCKVKTLSVTSMRVHMRRHTGEKPFQCSECGRRFARNDNLNAHFQLHFRAT